MVCRSVKCYTFRFSCKHRAVFLGHFAVFCEIKSPAVNARPLARADSAEVEVVEHMWRAVPGQLIEGCVLPQVHNAILQVNAIVRVAILVHVWLKQIVLDPA